MLLRFDPDRRFTCGQCGRCCRRGRVVLTATEAERYKDADLGQLYETDTPLPMLENVGRQVVLRPRADGSCGFLAPDNTCRIHARLGAGAKPLSCRLFPFAVHALDAETVVTASASCPAVAGGEGTRLGDQAPEVRRLARAWTEAFPGQPAKTVLAGKRTLDTGTLTTLREGLEALLLRPDGDLRANVGLIAQRLEDLTRWRVARLDDAAFTEYLTLTTRHAVTASRVPPRPPTRAGRRLVRAVLAAALGLRERHLHPEQGFLARAVGAGRVLAHLHGIGPATAGFDLRRARPAAADPADPAVGPLASAYLLSAVRTLGSGPGTLVDELALAAAVLEAAFLLAGDSAARRGDTRASAGDLRVGLADAADVLAASSTLTRGLRSATSGTEALYLFGSPAPAARLPRP